MQCAAPLRILVVDDEKVIRDGCERALAGPEIEIHKAENGTEGIARLGERKFDIVLLDLMMPGIDGFSVLKWVRENRPDTQVIVITGFATVAKAVEAMKEGAFDFVGKPFTPDYIRLVVRRAAEKRALVDEAARLRGEKIFDLETIAEEQSRLKTVFGCIEEAIVVTNRECVVVLHNPVAIRLLALQTDPVIGKHLSESVPDPSAVAMVEEVIRAGATVSREFPPGTISRLYLRAHCAPVKTPAGKVLGSITTFDDITSQKHVDQLKSEFVAMVVHELRAPLASVEQMVFAVRGLDESGHGRRAELLNRIDVRIKDQLQMIENLLNLSKLETGAAAFNMELARGNDLLAEAIEVARPRAECRRICLGFETCPRDWWIAADRDQIMIVFTNLIDNAIKYTPEDGRVEVAASVAGNLARVRVSDTGIGITAEDLPHIFDRFFRVRGKATRGVAGAGLGLSLVKKVVDAHHGCIDVESCPEKGTTFTVSLPLVDAPSPGTCRP